MSIRQYKIVSVYEPLPTSFKIYLFFFIKVPAVIPPAMVTAMQNSVSFAMLAPGNRGRLQISDTVLTLDDSSRLSILSISSSAIDPQSALCLSLFLGKGCPKEINSIVCF